MQLMSMMAGQIIDLISIISLFVASLLIFYVLAKYYRGMRTPPFWIYIAGGFILITLASVLTAASFKVDGIVLQTISMSGHLLFLVGAIALFRSYSSRIKFDKESD